MRSRHATWILIPTLWLGTACSSAPENEQTAKSGDVRQPEAPEYPTAWQVPLKEAFNLARFPVLVPSHRLASRENLETVYLYPDASAVVLVFPLRSPPAAPLRQNGIHIFETPWLGGDPLADFEADIANDPVTGKRIHDVSGSPALGVEAHAPEDATGENPAFLRLVMHGIDVQLSGGESVEDLIEIAKTLR